MSKKLLTTLCAVLLVGMVAMTANGQSIIYPLKADVPFSFSVGNKPLPPGEYIISTTTTPTVLLIRGDHDIAVAVGARILEHPVGGPGDKLVFHVVNGEYFLQSIWTADSDLGFRMPTSPREKEMIAAGAKPESTVIVASAAH